MKEEAIAHNISDPLLTRLPKKIPYGLIPIPKLARSRRTLRKRSSLEIKIPDRIVERAKKPTTYIERLKCNTVFNQNKV